METSDCKAFISQNNENYFPLEKSLPSIEHDGSLSLRGLYVSNRDGDIIQSSYTPVDLFLQEGQCGDSEPENDIIISFFDEESEKNFLSRCVNGYQHLNGGGNIPSCNDDWECVEYMSKIRVTRYFTKWYNIVVPSNVKMTNEAVEFLKAVTGKMVSFSHVTLHERVKDDVLNYFHKFGSHVSVGPFVVGGCCIEIVRVSDCKCLDTKTIWKKLEDEFNSMEPDDVDISATAGDAVIVAIGSEETDIQYIELNRKIYLLGGKATSNYEDWRNNLSTSLHVLLGNKSSQPLVPIWDILTNHEDLFGEKQHILCQILKHVWVEHNEENDPVPELFTVLGLPDEMCSLSAVRILRQNTVEDTASIRNVFWRFVRSITSLDHRGRDLKICSEVCSGSQDSNESDTCKNIFKQAASDITCMDIIYGILHRSDHFLRQELLWKMAECNLAVPLLLPGIKITDPVEFQCWGLQKIYKSWKPKTTDTTVKQSVVTYPLPIVTFIRYGRLMSSKSRLLNKVMGKIQGTNDHSYFNENVDPPYTKWSKGTLEVSWFVPEPGRKGRNALLDAVSFCNLRGDALIFPTQTEFICKASDIVVLLVDDKMFQRFLPQVEKLSELSRNHLVCVLSDGPAKGLNIEHKGDLTTISGVRDPGEVLCQTINKLLWPVHELSTERISIESLRDGCAELNINIDMNVKECLSAKALAYTIYKNVSESQQNYKQSNMPLQGDYWKRVTLFGRERNNGYRSSLDQETCDIEIHRAVIDGKIRAIRETEIGIKPSNDLLRFIEAFSLPQNGRQFFLAWFNIYLYQHFQENLDELARLSQKANDAKENEEANVKVTPREISDNPPEDQYTESTLKKELVADLRRNIQSRIENRPPALEDFIRELAQYFEAFEETKGKSFGQRYHGINQDILPGIAADVLLGGYPLEILDGEVGCIPMKWIQAVLKTLSAKIGNAMVSTVAVIGVQSSGKSTLLNTMFGGHFAVRGGRCTRGVYIQLLKVHKDLRNEIRSDYVIIIDTEGLKSSERTSSDDVKYENILATFALCLADVTIINISGQTVGPDVTDVLEIAAHALIRIGRVQKKCSCRIVQQFVADPNAENENELCTQLVIEKLNEVTAAAAESEGYGEEYTKFSDVVNLKYNKAVQYIPSLWYGSMSPPNHRYSDKVIALRKVVMSDIATSGMSLDHFAKMILNVWNALQEEDFLFSFQNSVTALLYRSFQVIYGKWIGDMRQLMMEKEISAMSELRGESNSKLHETKRRLRDDLIQVIANKTLIIKNNILHYLEEKGGGGNLRNFEGEFLRDLEATQRDFEHCVDTLLEGAVESNNRYQEKSDFLSNCGKDLRKYAREQLIYLRKEGSTADSLETFNRKDVLAKFDDIFSCWEKSIPDTQTSKRVSPSDVEREIDSHLLQREHKWGISIGKFSHEIEHTRNGGSTYTSQITKQSDVSEMVMKNSLSVLKKDIASYLIFDRRTIQRLMDSTFENLFTTKLTTDDVVRAVVEIRRRAVPIIVHGRNEYSKKHSLQQLLHTEMDRLREEFVLYCSFTKEDQRASEAFASMIIHASTQTVRGSLGSAICRFIRREYPYFDSKFALYGRILEYIAVKENFDDYPKFIFDPELFVEEWSLNNIAEICIKETKEGTTVLHQLTNGKVKKTLKGILDVTESIKSHVQSENGDITPITWIERLATKLRIVIPQFCFGDKEVTQMKEFDIKDICYFTEEVTKYIENHFEKNILQQLDLPESGNVEKATTMLDTLPTVPHQELTKQIRAGCKEKCPICHAPCDNMTRKHEKHRAELHYPEGVIGSVAARDNCLLSAICTSSITTDDSYWDGQRKLKYCDYQNYYPNWVIQPIKGDAPTKYWKWVLSRFNGTFARFYSNDKFCCGPAELPPGWEEITKEDALTDLRETYTLL